MDNLIALRLDKELMKKIDAIVIEMSLDRSAVMRNLLKAGIREFMKENASKLYKEGKTTLSKAAQLAGLTFFEMEQYMIEKGFKSEYSIDDLEEDMLLLNRMKK